MTLPFYLSPEAEAEMEAAALWYERQLDGLGAQFLAAVDQVLARIADHPHTGSPVPRLADETIRRMPLNRFPYHVGYLEFPDRYQILALALVAFARSTGGTELPLDVAADETL